MSLNGVIADLATGTYSVSRPNVADGYDSNGEWSAGAPTVFNIVAVAQPVMANESLGIQALAEGRNIEEMYEVRTVTALAEKDTITIDNESWEVVRVKVWDLLGEIHYSALCARQEIP